MEYASNGHFYDNCIMPLSVADKFRSLFDIAYLSLQYCSDINVWLPVVHVKLSLGCRLKQVTMFGKSESMGEILWNLFLSPSPRGPDLLIDAASLNLSTGTTWLTLMHNMTCMHVAWADDLVCPMSVPGLPYNSQTECVTACSLQAPCYHGDSISMMLSRTF